MDWARAIERNRDALKAIVTSLFGMLDLMEGAVLARLSPGLHRAVLQVLRPAVSAVRRLIVIAARGLSVRLPPSRPIPMGPIGRNGNGRPVFRLFDPQERLGCPRRGKGIGIGVRNGPRLHVFGPDPRVVALWPASRPQSKPLPPPDGSVDARRLCRRLAAIRLVLDDIPRQARRLARWRLRRQALSGRTSVSPLRIGRPPGYRRQPVHDVDRILVECHDLARLALASDTS